MTSIKPKLLGGIAILTAILGAATALLDDNPATNPDWLLISSAITAGWAAMWARENKTTSENALAVTDTSKPTVDTETGKPIPPTPPTP